jgi:PAS domain S-box-containing protein
MFTRILSSIRTRFTRANPITLQNIIMAAPDGVLAITTDQHLIYVNPTAERMLEIKEHDVIGKPVNLVFNPFPELLAMINAPGEAGSQEITIHTSKGPSYTAVHPSVIIDRDGKPVGKLVTLQDANQKNQLKRTLQQAEEKFSFLVENISEAFFSLNNKGQIIYISPVIEQHTGFPADNFIGKYYYEFIYSADLPELESKVTQMLYSELSVIEFRLQDRNNRLRNMRSYSRRVMFGNQPAVLQGVLTDITERKNVEEALEKRASQLAVLNEIGEQITAVIELNNVMGSSARLIQKHFGYYHVAIFTPNEARNLIVMQSASGAFANIFPENYHFRYGQGMVGWVAENQSTLLANNVFMEPRYTNLYPDKISTRSELAVPILVGDKLVGVLDIQSPALQAFDDDDVRVLKTVAGQIAVAMENARLYEEVRLQLKERERRENMLRIQRDLLVQLSTTQTLAETLQTTAETLLSELNASRAAISLLDQTNQKFYFAAKEPSDLIEEQQASFINPTIADWVIKNAQPLILQNTSSRPNPDAATYGTSTFLYIPLLSNAKTIGIIIVESEMRSSFSQEDILAVNNLTNSLVMVIEKARLFEEVQNARSELEVRASELEKANAGLLELDRLKSQFLANITHELRTPLNSIIGFSEVIIDGLAGPVNDEQKEYSQDILDSGNHLLALINNLLDFSKITAGKANLDLSTFQLESLFEELRATMAPMIAQKSQELAISVSTPLPPLTADRLRIKQVLLNLISNANKFTPEHGHIWISLKMETTGHFLIQVRDTGIGIRPEDHQLIFEEFRQVDGSLTREATGTGLGLAISRRIIEMHHGKIWVESELGKGATFSILLPVIYQENRPES